MAILSVLYGALLVVPGMNFIQYDDTRLHTGRHAVGNMQFLNYPSECHTYCESPLRSSLFMRFFFEEKQILSDIPLSNDPVVQSELVKVNEPKVTQYNVASSPVQFAGRQLTAHFSCNSHRRASRLTDSVSAVGAEVKVTIKSKRSRYVPVNKLVIKWKKQIFSNLGL